MPPKGKLVEHDSVSLKLSCRMAFELAIAESEIVPINLGDHDELY